MKRAFISLVLFLSSIVFTGGISVAEEGVLRNTYGKVIQVSENKVVILEYIHNNPTQVEYLINSETELRQMKSIKDIKVGDGAKIQFVSENGQNIAKIIVLRKIKLDQGPGPDVYYPVPERLNPADD